MSATVLYKMRILSNSLALKRRTVAEYFIMGILVSIFLDNPFDVIDSLAFFSLLSSLAIGLAATAVVSGMTKTKSLRLNVFDAIILSLAVYTIIRFSVQKDFYILNEKFLLTIGMAIYYFIIRLIKPDLHRACNFLISLYVINVLLGLLETSGILRGYTFSWALENSAIYSIYMSSFIPIVMYRAYYTSKRINRLLFLFIITVGIVLLCRLNSRTSWIALTVSLCFMGLYMSGWFNGKRNMLLYPIAFVLIIVMSLSLYSYKKDSSDGRMFIYGNTLDMVCDAALFGHGFDAFKVKYLDYQAKYFSIHKDDKNNILLADNTRTAFNDYMLVWAEQGIFAVILLIAALFWIITHVNKDNIHFACGLGIFVISSCFSYPMYSAPCSILAIFLSGCIVNGEDTLNQKTQTRSNVGRIFAGIICVCYMLLSISNMVLYAVWNNSYKKVLTFDTSGFYTYNKISPFMYGNGGFLFNYGSELLFADNMNHSALVLNSAKKYFNDNLLYLYLGDAYMGQQLYPLAEEHYRHAIDMVPNRLYPRYRLLKLYEEKGQEHDAMVMAKEIMSCEVKIPSNTTNMIRKYATDKLTDKNYGL